MKQFDLISDIHLDFWIRKLRVSNEPQIEIIKKFADAILPDEISPVLVIAGDLGHDNNQNFEFLKLMSNHYLYILIVEGNHDYYLENSTAKYKFNRNSLARWKNMKELGSTLEGVHFLKGTKIEINGVTFGGTGMWYDFSYGIQKLNKTIPEMEGIWHKEMNDEKYLFGLPKLTLRWFEKEKQLLEGIINDCDVIVTHVGPDFSKIPTKYELDPVTGFYFFNGSEYLKNMYGKIWCFGHSHNKYDYMKNGCWLVNNALGYPSENPNGPRRIVNIPLESHF